MQQTEIPGHGGVARVADHHERATVYVIADNRLKFFKCGVDRCIHAAAHQRIFVKPTRIMIRRDDAARRGGAQHSPDPLRAGLPVSDVKNGGGFGSQVRSRRGNVAHRRYHVTFAGRPSTTALAGPSPSTRLPAEIIAPAPTREPGRSSASSPIQTPAPTATPAAGLAVTRTPSPR